MLKECRDHGYFRGEMCPVCGDKGKFLINKGELDHIGRIMAGVLRHFPERFGLEMDEHGWVNIRKFVDAVYARHRRYHWLRTHHINAIIESDPKGRYQIRGDMMRATYGHSFDIDLDLPTDNIPDALYYPTTTEEVDIILETGLKPSDRKLVHLSKTFEDAWIAGKHRVSEPVILAVDAKGAIENDTVIKQAGKTVFLAKEVRPEFLTLAGSEEGYRAPEEEHTDSSENTEKVD